MPISTVWILKYIQQCYFKWFWTISSLGAPAIIFFQIDRLEPSFTDPVFRFRCRDSVSVSGLRTPCFSAAAIWTDFGYLHLSLKEKDISPKNTYSDFSYTLCNIKIWKKSNFLPLPRKFEFVWFLQSGSLKSYRCLEYSAIIYNLSLKLSLST